MAQRFNRLVTISGYSVATDFRLTRHKLLSYTDVDEDLTVTAFGQWFVRGLDPDTDKVVDLPAPTMSTDLLTAMYFRVNQRLSELEYLPNLPTLFIVDRPSSKILFLGPTDADFVSADVNFATFGVYQSDGSRHFNIKLENNTAGGDAFPIVMGNIDIGVEGLGGNQLTQPSTKRVWAQLSERGAGLAFLIGVAGVSDEGQSEDIEIFTRYDPALIYGLYVIDDLGRRWTITESRTSEDRRHLIYTASRLVVTDEEIPLILEGNDG